jgi:hypothetical protein
MKENPNPDVAPVRSAGGSLRAVASLCITALAVAGVLVVLEIVPRSAFAEIGGKVLGVGAIVLVAALAIGLSSRR